MSESTELELEIREVMDVLMWLGEAAEFLRHMNISPPADSDKHLHIVWERCPNDI